MRTRTLLPVGLIGGAALALTALTPGYAVATTWVSPTDSWWSTAVWSGPVPGAGDDVVFAGGPRSTYDLGNLGFESFRFDLTHTIANGGGGITLRSGIVVSPVSVATIEPQLTTFQSQQWSVAAGGLLSLPSQVNADPTQTLTLEIDGIMEVTGNLDGGGTACIVKTGLGVLRFANGGGGVGSCSGGPEGLRVEAGFVEIASGAALGGKSFAVFGGELTGGETMAPGVVRQLNLGAGGTVSPGPALGSGIGTLDLWGTSAWNGGSYVVDWDPASGASDLVLGTGQAISVDGTVLAPRVLAGSTPDTERSFPVLSSDVVFTGAFSSPAGDVLRDGDEFVSDGQVYRYGQGSNTVTVTWLREAPVPPGPPTPNPPAPVPPAPAPPQRIDTAAAGLSR